VGDKRGPFQTVTATQIVDYELRAGAAFTHHVPAGLDNSLVYATRGSGSVNGAALAMHQVAHLDAGSGERRAVQLQAPADGSGLRVIIFSGKRLNEPIAWHGPFVMNTDAEIQRTIEEYRQGRFLRRRTAWDYKRWDAFPASEKGQL
jgi:quercetin 2,3-dioxygenase